MWTLILLGLALEVSAGVCAWRQPVRTYPNTLYWQAMLVVMAGAGWLAGAGFVLPLAMAWWLGRGRRRWRGCGWERGRGG